MKSPITKLAAAAVVIVAVLTGVHWFSGSIDGVSVAWGDVLENIDRVKDYTYRQRQIDSSGVIPTGFEFKGEWEMLWYYSSEFGTRWDQYHAGEAIGQYYVQLKKQQTVWLHPQQKTFSSRAEQLSQTMPLDPRSYIRQIMTEPYVHLGQRMIDGVMAEGIEVHGQKVGGPLLDNAVSRLWVDVETELPVWLEAEGKCHGSDTYTRLIQDQFQWNVNLTEADFTPDIPSDYTQEDWPTNDSDKWAEIVTTYTNQRTEVNFSILEELGLLGTDRVPEQPLKKLTGIDEIHEAQEQVMRNWPSYAELRQLLHQELDEKLNLKSRSDEELVYIGVLLREKFWDAGGCFSPVSYRYGYMARVLLEIAYARRPDDLAVGDEVAEAIMATGTLMTTPGFSDALREIRSAQFRQICEQVQAGASRFGMISPAVLIWHFCWAAGRLMRRSPLSIGSFKTPMTAAGKRVWIP